MTRRSPMPGPWPLFTALALIGALVPSRSCDAAESRGELLYSTHCVACHSAQVHWRDRKLATDLRSLEAQVRNWQAASGLRWSDEDVTEVTRYLDDRFYHFAPAVSR